jgi:cation diffusion facilitator family transporter
VAEQAHTESAAEAGSTAVVFKALAANIGIAVAKFIVAFISLSASMMSEAVHSAADSGNQLFLLLGMRRSERREDAIHEFGYATERYFWAFIVAVSLFTMGATFSIYEGVEKIMRRDETGAIGNATWAYVVLGVSIALELFSLTSALAEFREVKAGRTLRQTIDEARDAVVIIVLFEDSAALVGLAAAFAGILLTHLTGDAVYDGIASIVVGCTLGSVAYFLARKTKHLLIGQSVTPAERKRIMEIVQSSPGIARLLHLRTMHLGPEEVLVAMKVVFADPTPAKDIAQYIDVLEARVRAEMPIMKRIYVEVGVPVDPGPRLSRGMPAVDVPKDVS